MVTLRWHPDGLAHAGVEVDDFGVRMLDLEVRYRKVGSPELPRVGSREYLGQ